MFTKQQEQQFNRAYDTYFGSLFKYCYYRLFDKEKTKDVVQEAYCRVWKYILGGHEIKNMKSFLYKTAKNIMIDQFKKKKSVSLDYMMEKGFSPGQDPRQQNENYFTSKEVLAIVESLDKKYSDVIVLKYVSDLSTKEISQVLGESENNIYVRLNRGFTRVKEIAAGLGFEPR